MSGYVLKSPGSELEYALDWRQGYLERMERVTHDLGWRVLKAAPAWLFSMVVHLVLVFILALIQWTQATRPVLQIEASYADTCARPPCPTMGCAFEPTSVAICRNGRCAAGSLGDL